MKTASKTPFHIDFDRLKDLLTEIAAFGKDAERGISRLGFSEAGEKARAWLMSKMRASGLDER